MGVNSRQKGARFERQLASLFREQGYEARRTAQYCGNTGDASDVVGLPHIHVEAKHAEQMRLYEWMDQAKRDARKSGSLPTVFHKKNNAATLVTMELDDWFKLYREYEAGTQEEEEEDFPCMGCTKTCHGKNQCTKYLCWAKAHHENKAALIHSRFIEVLRDRVDKNNTVFKEAPASTRDKGPAEFRRFVPVPKDIKAAKEEGKGGSE